LKIIGQNLLDGPKTPLLHVAELICWVIYINNENIFYYHYYKYLFLGGYGILSNGEITKEFGGLPAHK
jgi:hypothetical protein